MVSPTVLGRRHALEEVRRLVTIEQHEAADGIRVRVAELLLPEFLSDQRAHRIGAARRVPLLDPPVEGRQQLGLHGQPESDHALGHGRTSVGRL